MKPMDKLILDLILVLILIPVAVAVLLPKIVIPSAYLSKCFS